MNLGDTVQSVAGSPREWECVRADAARGGQKELVQVREGESENQC